MVKDNSNEWARATARRLLTSLDTPGQAHSLVQRGLAPVTAALLDAAAREREKMEIAQPVKVGARLLNALHQGEDQFRDEWRRIEQEERTPSPSPCTGEVR